MKLFAKAAGVEQELARLPDALTRAKVLDAARRDRRIRKRAWIELAASVCVAPAIVLSLFRLTPPTQLRMFIAFFLAVAVFPLLLAPLAALLSRKLYQRVVREQLRSHSIRLCLSCGYDLRGIDGDRCPECGQPDEEIVPVDTDILPLELWDHVRIRSAGLLAQLSIFGDETAQRRAWRAICRGCEGRQAIVFLVVIPGAVALAVFGSLLIPIVAMLVPIPITYLLAGYLGVFATCFLGAMYWSHATMLRIEAKRLRDHVGLRLREQCGYDLRGAAAVRCPECGTEARVALGPRTGGTERE